MTLRYWLMVVCVALLRATFCDALATGYQGTHHYLLSRGASGHHQQSSPSLDPRPRYRPVSQLYPRWPLPGTEPHNPRVRWPSGRPGGRPGALPASPRFPQTDANLRSASMERPHRGGSVASSLHLDQPNQAWRRSAKQWMLPRKFFTISSTTGGSNRSRPRNRGTSCTNGKVWRRGACRCPYLSNWNSQTSMCECVYGTYRHTTGHCYSF